MEGYGQNINGSELYFNYDPSKSYTAGEKFVWQSPSGDWRTYLVRPNQTLLPGQTPFTNPEKVDKINPFDNYRMRWVTGQAGGAAASNGLSNIQNWLYDVVRDKYVIAGGATSDNIIIFERTLSLPDMYASVNSVNIGHDVVRVVHINDEYWAFITSVPGTITITRVSATTNTVISTFTSTYTGTISGGFFRVRNNKMYYAAFQSTVTAFQLYEIDGVSLATTAVITAPAATISQVTWWFDEVNGFVCTTSNIGNTYRVYNINTFTLLGTYNVVCAANTVHCLEPIHSSDGNTYILLPQSTTYGFRVLQINKSTGEPTQVTSIGYTPPSPNNGWQVLYDQSNPDWAFLMSGSGVIAGVAYLVNVITSEMIPIQTPVYYATSIPNTLSQYRYFNKQLEAYIWVSGAGVSTTRQIIRMDFR